MLHKGSVPLHAAFAFSVASVTFAALSNLTVMQSVANLAGLEILAGLHSQLAYRVRLAESAADREAAYRLRFKVFNLELNEGLAESYISGQDTDAFDAGCDHLIVEQPATGKVVGTYRLQTGALAAANIGYYSAREFDFAPYEAIRSQLVELGRACIAREHRSPEVLYMLWRAITQYAMARSARYLVGCCSLTSQDPSHGAAVYRTLQEYQVAPELRTLPTSNFVMPLAQEDAADGRPPKLLRAYLAIGAQICGPPAIDREFKTIDFLTLMDLHSLHPRLRRRFLGM